MVAKPLELGPENDCAGKDQQHIQKTYPSSRQRRRPTKTRPQLVNSNKYLVMSPRWGSTPRLTDWPSVAMWLGLWLWLTEGVERAVESKLPVVHSHGKFVVGEELEVGLWRLNVWFEAFMCTVVQLYLECDGYNSVLKSIARKRIGKTLQKNND
jgi:hypothetical protein